MTSQLDSARRADGAGAAGSADGEGSVTRLPDGRLMAQRDAPIGGQAVLEGVMMRGLRTWAVAVRKPLPGEVTKDGVDPELGAHGEIEVRTFPFNSWTRRHRVLRWPVIRGVVALVESLKIGFAALGISANEQLPEDEEPIGKGAWAGTIVFAFALGIGLFFLAPLGVTSLFERVLGTGVMFWLVEGIIRTVIFLGYIWLISRLRDLRRVFEYHGAEHKVIAAYEAGDELTPERADRYSRLHPRCGTTFLLILMIVSIFAFAPVGLPEWYWLILSRIIGVPLIAGVSFEIIKWLGRNRSKSWVQPLMWPGLQLQRLTTRPPDAAQLAVAIVALQAVLEVEKPGEERAEGFVGVEVAA